MASADTAKLIAALTLKDGFSGPIKNANKALNGFDAHLKETDSRATKFGKQIGTGIKSVAKAVVGASLLIGSAAAAISIKSLDAAADFEAQLNTINTIARASKSGLAEIGLGIRKVATDTGTSLDDLTAGYYDLLSAGIKAADAQNVLTNANKLAIGGLSTTSEAIDLLTSAINTYGGDATKAAEYTDVFAKAVERGKVTAAGIAESFSIVGPLAKSAGISIQEIGAAFARLTSAGVPAAEAATQMRSALVALEKPTPALGALEDDLKKNYLAIAGKQGLVVALQQMATDAGKAGIPLIDLFGRIEAVNFTLATTGPNFGAYNADLAAMGKAAGTAAGQMAERQQGLNFQLARLKALAKDAGITIGSALLPKITPLVEKLNAFISGNQAGIAAFGEKIASLFSDSNIKEGSTLLSSMFDKAKEVAPAIARAAQLTGEIVKKAVDLFRSLPPEVQALAVTGLAVNKITGGLITNVAGGFADIIKTALTQRGQTPANPLFVSDVSGGLAGAAQGVGTAVAGAGGISLAALAVTVAALIAAPAVIAAVGLAVTNPSNNARDRAKTAAARGGGRGTPTVDGKTIDDLTLATKYASSTEEQVGKSADDLAVVVLANTAATKAATDAAKAAKHRSIYEASAAARGFKYDPSKTSTSLEPRFKFLAGNQKGSKDVAVARALTEHFTTSSNPLYTNDKNLSKTIKVLQRDQHQLLSRGDTKSAAAIGREIERLKAELARRTAAAATKTAAAAKAAGVKTVAALNAQRMTVNLDTRTIINGRLFDATLERFSTKISLLNAKGI